MHQPKHRATRVPTTRRRAATLGTAAFGAVAVGVSTFTGGVAQAAPVTAAVAITAPVAAAVPAASPVSTNALPAVELPTLSLVSHPTSVVVATRSRRAALTPSAVARRAVSAAASRKGTPYRYGAAGPRAFDCSGLAKWSFARAGKRIPRTTSAQYRASHKVSKAARRPGDLIFYMSHGRPYHVGVYAGNNTVWIARHTGTRITLQKIYSRNYAVGRFA